MSNIQLFNQDCMEAMASMKDKEFELAIVDPPYGINVQPIEMGKWRRKIHNSTTWDLSIPPKHYFTELYRISTNQVIWGGNYFIEYLKNTPCFIVWDKKNGNNPLADCELAWTSFTSRARRFEYNHIQEYNAKIIRIHPTQKPVALYQWLLKNYAKQGDRILDTHLGSGSSAIAADIMGYDFTGYEIDKDYYEAALDRFNRHKQQTVLEFA